MIQQYEWGVSSEIGGYTRRVAVDGTTVSILIADELGFGVNVMSPAHAQELSEMLARAAELAAQAGPA